MRTEEWRAFVRHGTRTGKLATVQANGHPHVAPVWFVLDTVTMAGGEERDEILFNTGAGTAKGRALRRDPRFSLCVDDENPPYSFVLLQAEATITEDLDEMRAAATRIAARYVGEDQAEAYGNRNAVPGELLIRAPVTKVIAQADLAG